ncbi:Endoglucanase-4 [Dactylellina cionopaga]|nr:Endoglucanase-4 [Dactylellina cionopaga]
MKSSLVALLYGATSVLGHGFIVEMMINGQSYPGFDPLNSNYANGVVEPWDPPSGATGRDGPQLVRNGVSMVCQLNAKAAQQVAQAPAGSQITFQWNQWPEDHQGPLITYLSDCNGDCTNANSAELNWFKIDETGFENGQWATDIFRNQGEFWTIQLPQNIKSGQYIMRHEIIALHDPNDGPQFYPTCVHLDITGGTGQTNPEGVRIQDVYTREAPGLDIDTKSGNPSSYTVPGPAISSDLGVTLSSQLNTGTGKRAHLYPNPDQDPYASQGSSASTGNADNTGAGNPSASSSASADGTAGESAPTENNAQGFNTGSGAPSDSSNGAPLSDPNNGQFQNFQTRSVPAGREGCNVAQTKCLVAGQRQARFRFRRRSSGQNYAADSCRRQWEACLGRILKE